MTVYCGFQFFNELELLSIKLEELSSVVDYFVISEGTFTHSGKPKELYFWDNRDLFSKFSHKIIYQRVNDTPNNEYDLYHMVPGTPKHIKVLDMVKKAYWFDHNNLPYLHDTYEKEMVFHALPDCRGDDIIVLGDLDEIPRATTLRKIINHFDPDIVYHMQHDFNWYYANINKCDETWYGNMVMSYDMFSENSFCEMRNFKKGIFVDNGGWHLSYMGGRDRIKQKIESWGEQSLNTPFVKDSIESNVRDCLFLGRDLFFRPAKFNVIPVEEPYLPKYLVENKDKFSSLIYKE